MKRSSKAALFALVLIALVGAGVWYLTNHRSGSQGDEADSRSQEAAGLDLGRLLGGAAPEGFLRVTEPRPFVFPEDHGPHPGYRSEWWYFTGNLEAKDGRAFGYQLTIFRSALAPKKTPEKASEESENPEKGSAWATNQVFMGHFALSDIEAGQFSAFQRLARQAVGLAGAQAEPFEVWVGPWRMESLSEEFWPLRLQAGDSVAIDLIVEPEKEMVLQGDRGYSRKGEEAGNASYYYSFTRLATRGTVRTEIGDSVLESPVTGTSWLDREWSTSALGADQVGWDWFALQLEDGSELMLYSLRQADGGMDPASAGTLVRADGSSRRLRSGEFTIVVEDRWRSPDGVALYPSRWKLSLPSEDLRLEVRPRQANQELLLAVRYWEGSVEVRGTKAGKAVSGLGYVELTGYAGSP